MNAPQRRGRCPGLSEPMETGDGLLARLRPAGTVSCSALAGLLNAAGTHGNGIVEVTGRGSIQARGLTAASARPFAAAVAALGIDAIEGVSVHVNPLAGLDPGELIDATAMADALRRRVTPLHLALGPKVSVAMDGGGSVHLDALPADIRLRVASAARRVHVAVGGDAATATPLGMVAAEDCVEAATRLLGVIAARGVFARARGLISTDGIDAFRAAVAELLLDAPAPPVRPPAEAIGTHGLRDGRLALGIALAFGHARTHDLECLADAGQRAGADGIRTAPERVLLIVGITAHRLSILTAAAERLGLIVDPADPRRSVITCAGAPVCASAQIPTRPLAPVIADIAGGCRPDDLEIHLSGCSKGCAHGGPAALTLVGTRSGCGVVTGGTARDGPVITIPTSRLPQAVAKLMRAADQARLPGERLSDALARFEPARVAALMAEQRT